MQLNKKNPEAGFAIMALMEIPGKKHFILFLSDSPLSGIMHVDSFVDDIIFLFVLCITEQYKMIRELGLIQ
ncbi:hypothetical protein PF003_g3381 [Phytophthora fragariae]|nr:hypothetical protein PF003_g3381 [Phytophthora fragariae]